MQIYGIIMIKQVLTYTLFLLATVPALATTGGTGTGKTTGASAEASTKVATVSAAAPAVRQFAGLEDFMVEAVAEAEVEMAYALHEEGMFGPADVIDSAQYYVAKAQEVISEIRDMRKFVGYLDGESLLSLPVGIHKEINGQSYDIGIASVKLKPHYAELEVYMQFSVPQNDKVLTFYGKGIKFSKEGGIMGDGTLELVADYAINLQGDKSQLILKSGTQVEFSCGGFEKMILDAQVKFSRDLLRPEDANGRVKEGNVMADFRTELRSWDDLLVQISLPPFQVKGLDGVGFTVSAAVFDFSDQRNAPSVRFPENYAHPDIQAGLADLWQGFYLRELSVRLPAQFNKDGSSTRTSFAAYDVLIDHMGFTGQLSATDLIRLDDGNMNGWAYSLDSIGIRMEANQMVAGGFIGNIVIPVNEGNQAFEYTAIINPGNEYIFNVESPDSLEFSVFQTSKVELYPASYVEISVVDGKFRPKANLNGRMNIAAKMGNGGKSLELADITFEDLQLQSVKPYLTVGNFSFGSEGLQQKMANFPVSINNIGMRNIGDDKVAVDFDLIVNLAGDGGGSFGAEAGLSIRGKMPGGKLQRWQYDGLDVHRVAIDVDGGAYKFKGSLQFYSDDPVYGDGFNGQVEAEFQPGVKVQATAIFGNVDGYRYWYADALASLPTGTPIFTGVAIYGFGGGAYYHMSMDTEGVGSSLGETASGTVYVPRGDAGLGLKATVEIGSFPKPEAFNGDVTLEIAFFEGGGIRYISLKGNGYLATPPATGALAKIKDKTQKLASAVAKLEDAVGPAGALLCQNQESDQSVTQIYGQLGEAAGAKGQISAHVFISYDFENRVLHGNFEAYVNVAGGIIRGVGDGGRAGWAVLHFAPDDWYVYVGTPDDRIGLKVGVGSIAVSATSYFMVGTSIPGSPPPPDNVADILNMDASDLDYMRDLNALGNGAGFAFGASFSMDTGNLTFLMFYARFAAGAGFDIMLKDYGSATCAGSSSPIGINGWYANGQAYAYFEGEIGIRVKLFGRRKSVSILDIGAAALLQAKLPNPFWMRGIVGGRFSVLGGLVKGNCKFEVTIGKECDLQGGSVLEGIQVIAELTPNAGSKDVSVFNTPQAVFNMPVMKTFQMVDVDEKKKTFRIKLDEFAVKYNGVSLTGTQEWNAEKDVLAFNAFDVFPSEKDMVVVAQVSFEEWANGVWSAVVVDGKRYVERMEAPFTSGIAPDYIPAENVEYSYPVSMQLNYYPGETSSGYIKLKRGQPYLFQVDPNEWIQRGRFVTGGSSSALQSITYNSSAREVAYSLPSTLQANKIYAFELVNLPRRAAGAIDRNVSEATSTVASQGENSTELTTKDAQGTIDELQEKVIYGIHLRTSRYNTLSAKLNAADLTRQGRWPIRNGVHELIKTYDNQEYWDLSEIHGSHGQDPMIQFEAVLSDNYYKDYIGPIVYDGYPLQNKYFISWRDTDELGVRPVRALYIRQHPINDFELLEGHISTGAVTLPPVTAAFIYNLVHYYEKDWVDLSSQIATDYVNGGTMNSRLTKLVTSPFPRILGGNYQVRIKYVLPGKGTTTSVQTITITNPVY